MNLLGIFPSFHGPERGGVQVSGRAAWSAIRVGAARLNWGVQALGYGNPGPDSGDGDMKICRTKSASVLQARRLKRSELVIVWHLNLLKLLPFINGNNARIVLFLHGIEAWKRHSFLTRKLLGRVGLFLYNSRHTWDRFVHLNPEYELTPHECVPLGIAEPVRRPALIPLVPPTALMIGRLNKAEDYKGHREVVTAWADVVTRIPDATLVIAGEGDLKQELEKLRGKSRVKCVGWVDEDGKQDLLLKSRCLLLPSRGEGFGLVYAEAMRLGRPCLVSGLDAGSEVVAPPECGLAADPSDPQALADAIVQLMTDGPQWTKWSENARRRYERNFTETHFQNRLINALFPE